MMEFFLDAIGLRGNHYIMREDGTFFPEPNLMKWGRWMEDMDRRRIACTKVGPWYVDTVFLGINQGGTDEDPILFESAVFCEGDGYRHTEICRYRTLDDAKKGHEALIGKYAVKEDAP